LLVLYPLFHLFIFIIAKRNPCVYLFVKYNVIIIISNKKEALQYD